MHGVTSFHPLLVLPPPEPENEKPLLAEKDNQELRMHRHDKEADPHKANGEPLSVLLH